MRYTATALCSLALAGYANAHTRVWGLWVNGEFQGDGRSTYIRSPPSNDPVKDLTSSDIVCNVNGGTPAAEFVSVAAGDSLAAEWYHDNRGDDIIASSHKGPVQAYIAPYTTGNGASAIWTKIASKGYDASTKTWAVDDLIAAGGMANVTLPSSLAPGKYLLRSEIIGLHEADTAYSTGSRGAQFYPSCIQIEVTSGGSAEPSENFDFQTGYTYSDPGIVFSLYGSFDSYTAPGPDVWTGSGSSSGTATSAAANVAAATPVSSSAASVAPVATPSTTLSTAVASTPTTVPTSAPATDDEECDADYEPETPVRVRRSLQERRALYA